MKNEWTLSEGQESSLITLVDENPALFGRYFSEKFSTPKVFLFSQTPILGKWGNLFKKTLNGKNVEVSSFILPTGEEAKSLKTLQRAWEFLAKNEACRETPVIGLGGGSVTDSAGFIAATYHRGLPLILVPTTLLGIADSSIGGKNGINFKGAKNQIGTFYSPAWIYGNLRFLETLSEREWRSGLAEIIKAAVIEDESLFEILAGADLETFIQKRELLFQAVQRAIAIKINLVSKDPWDRNKIRAKLNFGHTIGHAVESAGKFGEVTHGEAVGLGMYWESLVSEKLGECRAAEVQKLEELLKRYAYSLEPARELSWKRYLFSDKKRTGKDLTFVFLRHIGQTVVKSVPFQELNECIRSF